MIDRVVICPACGEIDKLCFAQGTVDTDGPGFKLHFYCAFCAESDSIYLSWELAYRLLDKSLGLLNQFSDDCIDEFGKFSGLLIDRYLVRIHAHAIVTGCTLFALNAPFPTYLAEPENFKVIIYLLTQSSGDCRKRAFTVQDFLSCAQHLKCENCFGQPLAS